MDLHLVVDEYFSDGFDAGSFIVFSVLLRLLISRKTQHYISVEVYFCAINGFFYQLEPVFEIFEVSDSAMDGLEFPFAKLTDRLQYPAVMLLVLRLSDGIKLKRVCSLLFGVLHVKHQILYFDEFLLPFVDECLLYECLALLFELLPLVFSLLA